MSIQHHEVSSEVKQSPSEGDSTQPQSNRLSHSARPKKEYRIEPSKPPKADTPEAENNQVEHCFICTEPISCYSVGVCNHRTCHLCSLRLRVLYRNKTCGYCKTELKSVVFTRDPEKLFEQFVLKELPAQDTVASVYFDTQKLHDEIQTILRINCPDKKCDFHSENSWAGLEEHVNTVHQRSLCEICVKHKKVFSHEHTVFTHAQLQRHMTVGDSKNSTKTTGFKGHPECQFCSIHFYDGDQLFEHCRDKHEQCHICIRNGSGRHDYYASYGTLEQHFLNDHFLCTYQECLNKKFVVFQSDIDLKAHLVEEHRGSANQRAHLKQVRQIEVNFSYRDNNRSHSRSAGGRQESRQNRKEQPSGSKDTGSKPASHNKDSRRGKLKGRLNPPPEFGSTLTDEAPSTSSSDAQTANEPSRAENQSLIAPSQPSSKPPAAKTSTPTNKEILSNHASFLNRLTGYLGGNDERVTNFKQLTASYRSNRIAVSQYIDAIQRLVPVTKDHLPITGKIINGVAGLLDIERKKQELLSAWHDRKIQDNQDFPILETSKASNDPSASDGAARRVLVIKPKQAKAGQLGGSSKAKTRNRAPPAPKQTPTIVNNPPASRPSASAAPRPSANSGSTTPWSGKAVPHLVSPAPPKAKSPMEHFPSLPEAPKRPKIPGLSNRGGKVESAWGKQKEAP
ncbi:hypothetical protein K493DRAFT_262528, partial [Basidiobolus meristosporus CBS 931.73]